MVRLQSAIEYEDGRIDAFFADRTVLTLSGANLAYIGTTGLRVQALIGSIDRNTQELAGRLEQMIEVFNLHSDRPLLLPKLWSNMEFITKLRRIQEFTWPLYEPKVVMESQEGWRVCSLDGSASVLLRKDLLIMNVEYIQDINQREVQESEQFQYNTKTLLQKYRQPYEQYTGDSAKPTVVYRYIRMKKVFSVWNVPERWRYPCGLLWRHIHRLNLLQQDPLFVPETTSQPLPTKMPEPYSFSGHSNSLNNLQMPIFRYPNYPSPCKWLAMDVGSTQGLIWFRSGGPLGYDGKAFWQQVDETFHLKLFNTVESEKIYYTGGVPQVVRCGNYCNSVQEFLAAMASYNKHYHQNYQQSLNIEQPKGSFEEIDSITNEYAKLTAFGNRFVKARFHDGTIMTYDINKNSVKVINRVGQPLVLAITDNEYKPYLEVVLSYAEEIFQPEKKLWRQTMSQQLDKRLNCNLITLSVLEGKPVYGYISGDSLKTSIVTNFTEPTLSVEEAIARNSRLIEQLSRPP